MGGMQSLFGGNRHAAALGRGLLGFVGTFVVWSLLVGDWHARDHAHDRDDLLSGPAATSPRPAPLQPVWKGWHAIEDVVVFGDSYSSTRFSFQGERPSWEHPFGNTDLDPVLPYGEGPKWIQYLHTLYNQSYFRVTNLAAPGSTVERHYWEPRPQGQAPAAEKNTFKEQISLFKGSASIARMPAFDDWSPDATLFAAWFGVNEILHSTHRGLRLPHDAIFATYHASIERLYRLGARNFLLLNIPPIDAILPKPWPGFSSPPDDIADYNARVASMARTLRRRHPDVTIFTLDAHAAWTAALRAPAAASPVTARLRDTAGFCAGYRFGDAALDVKKDECDFARDQYFWMDDHRPSHVVQQYTALRVAEDCFAEGGPSGFCAGA